MRWGDSVRRKFIKEKRLSRVRREEHKIRWLIIKHVELSTKNVAIQGRDLTRQRGCIWQRNSPTTWTSTNHFEWAGEWCGGADRRSWRKESTLRLIIYINRNNVMFNCNSWIHCNFFESDCVFKKTQKIPKTRDCLWHGIYWVNEWILFFRFTIDSTLNRMTTSYHYI